MTGTETDATTTSASDADSTTSGGATSDSSTSGSGGGSQTAADQFAAERDRLEAARRAEQSRADRLQAELEAARRAAESTTDSSTAPSLDQVRAEIIRGQAIGAEAARLATSTDYRFADKSILNRAAEFDSVEALRAAVEQSHNERKAFLDEVGAVPKTEAEKQLAAYREKYGDLPSPTGTEGATSTEEPTIEQIKAMSFEERDAYEEEHGKGSLQRLISKSMRSEAQGG